MFYSYIWWFVNANDDLFTRWYDWVFGGQVTSSQANKQATASIINPTNDNKASGWTIK